MEVAAKRYYPRKSVGMMVVEAAEEGNRLVGSPVVRPRIHLPEVPRKSNSSGKTRRSGIRPLHQR